MKKVNPWFLLVVVAVSVATVWLAIRRVADSVLIVPKPPELRAPADEKPAHSKEWEKEHAAVVERSLVNGLADMQPTERLAAAFTEGKVTAEFPVQAPVTLEVARDISVALLHATDKMWLSKQWAEARGSEGPSSKLADFWIAVWPDLDRLVAEGRIGRSIEKFKEPAIGQALHNTLLVSITDDVMTVLVNAEVWSVRLTFTKDRNPAPELFARVLETQNQENDK